MKLTYNGIPVKVDGYIKMADISLVSVEATDGSKPFVGGDTYPIRTEYGVVRLDELIIDLEDECGCVLPEQSCAWCRGMSESNITDELPY